MRLGPGLLVTAAFIGPGTITTASVAGANFGFALIWTILFSVVATILLQAGADVSLVSKSRDGETRLTARASRNSTISGIHLGEMMKKLSSQLGGEGGGHDGAAGWSGKCERVAAESAFINLLANTRRIEL